VRALAIRYREPLVRYYLRRGLSMEAAEDCTQEVFVRVVRVDQTSVDKPEAYLFTTAARVLIDRARAAKTRQEQKHGPINDLMPGFEVSAVQVLEGKDALKRLTQYLAELPDKNREIFLLNRLEGLTYTQLAARYAMSVKAVEKQMSKALAHLRRRYASDDR
jgi:RNA polymerase sigma factor (sigma-70 family)